MFHHRWRVVPGAGVELLQGGERPVEAVLHGERSLHPAPQTLGLRHGLRWRQQGLNTTAIVSDLVPSEMGSDRNSGVRN